MGTIMVMAKDKPCRICGKLCYGKYCFEHSTNSPSKKYSKVYRWRKSRGLDNWGINGMEYFKSFLWNTRTLLHKLLNRCYYTIRDNPLVYFSLCGFIGSIFIDADHLVSRPFEMSRPFHIPILILVGCILLYSYTHMYRRFHKVSVKEK